MATNLHDLANMLDSGFRLYVVTTLRAFFRHLEIGHDKTFNYTMFAVPRRYWKATSDHFVSIGLTDRVTNHYYKYNEQEFVIPDPMTGGPGCIRLTVTAVNSDKGQFVAKREVDGMLSAIKLPADPKFVLFAKAVLAGHPNPMSLLEDQNKYSIPDTPAIIPKTRQLGELARPEQDRVRRHIKEITDAKARGEFPEVSW